MAVKNCNIFLLGLFFLLILGCARPHVLLGRTVILNATTDKITDVKVLHQPTNKSGSVNVILPQRALDIAFSGAPMLADEATVSWKDGQGIAREVTLQLPYSRTAADEGRIMNLVYIIYSGGVATVQLKRSTRSRTGILSDY